IRLAPDFGCGRNSILQGRRSRKNLLADFRQRTSITGLCPWAWSAHGEKSLEISTSVFLLIRISFY
ncbi:MAG TPA: hypothetical protein VJ044_00590, partial [Candidatus Hodarchaeales archaeon]|nr:hypothetical protein [Candidatus Hodarchaeales archaeon]